MSVRSSLSSCCESTTTYLGRQIGRGLGSKAKASSIKQIYTGAGANMMSWVFKAATRAANGYFSAPDETILIASWVPVCPILRSPNTCMLRFTGSMEKMGRDHQAATMEGRSRSGMTTCCLLSTTCLLRSAGV